MFSHAIWLIARSRLIQNHAQDLQILKESANIVFGSEDKNPTWLTGASGSLVSFLL